MVLLETQQTCDVTYRLYDYGRPRELHLEQGLHVMKTHTAAGKVPPVAMDGFTRLIEQTYFTVDRYDLLAAKSAVVPTEGAGCLVCLCGSAVVESDGADPVDLLAGQAVVVPATCASVVVRSKDGASFAKCFAPLAS
jgi:mannose-6-phosphate isomerase